jgi:GLPGLI family protein
MKNSIKILALLLLITSYSFGQNFQGKAMYKSIRSMEKMNFEMEGGDPIMEQRMKDMIKKQMEKEFELTYDQYSSIYKKQEALDATPQQSGGGMMMIIDDGDGGELYKNTKENRYASTRDVFGKEFLVKDKLQPFDWVLGKETKQIGNYTCYKATFDREQRMRKSVIVNGEDESEPEEIVENITVSAWYTPDIPVSNGPAMFWGLPGLILEVQDGNLTTICTQVVLNPKEKIEIKEPKGGKILNEEEYEKIMKEKMEEMQKINHGGKKKGDAHRVEINIEG